MKVGRAVAIWRWPQLAPPNAGLIGVFFLASLLGGCASAPPPHVPLDQLEPLQVASGSLRVADVDQALSSPDLLATDDEMRAFVARYTGGLRNGRQRLAALHGATKNSGVLGIEYDPFAEGGAIETFHRGTANCLSYANMFVALAREAGLDARYQWLEIRPQWSYMGERVAVRLHVNVVIKLRFGEEFMVDIDPLQPRDVSGSRLLSDADAVALYHNNIAMDFLAEEDLAQAWSHEIRALQLSPDMPHLWVNLGAIYRRAGQHRQAERNYLHALALNSRDHSAMNNLAILYKIEGREEERQQWLSRVENYRRRNPYYFAWMGDKSGEAGDWQGALAHYQDALKLQPKEGHLLYTVGLIYYQLEDFDMAVRYIKQAIDNATLHSEAEGYKLQLNALKRENMAVL